MPQLIDPAGRHETVRQIPRLMLGFTLIEVAIVVAIIAVLMTLGLGFLNSQISSNAYLITKRRMELVRDALIAHLGAHRRLPCPIAPTGTPVTGVEPTPTGSPPACPDAVGVLPYTTLGISRETAEDGWGDLFSYQVQSDSPPPACPGPGLNWGNRDCFGAGKAGQITVNDGASVIASSVIATIVSHGPNGLGAYVVQGTRNANPATCEEARNAHVTITATPPCTQPLPPVSSYVYYKGERPDQNDDVVGYLMASEAMQALSRQGAIKPASGKVGEDLQKFHDQTIGLNLTRACTDTFVMPTPTPAHDPWGNLYVLATSPASPTLTGLLRTCICSSGPGGSVPPAATCSPIYPAVCKSMESTEFNVYRNNAGQPLCS